MCISEKKLIFALAYYQAMNNKDLVAIERHLHKEVRLISPLADLKGKGEVLNSIKHLISFLNKVIIRAEFAVKDQVMLAYDIEFPLPIGISQAAVLLTFQDGLIIGYELFFDPRPFEKI